MKLNFWMVTTGLAILLCILLALDLPKQYQAGYEVGRECGKFGESGGFGELIRDDTGVIVIEPAAEEILDEAVLILAAIGDSNDFALNVYQDRVITAIDDVGFCVDPNGRTFCEVRAERGYHLDLTDLNWLTDASIRRLCESGRVCAVLGHQWGGTLEHFGKDGEYGRELMCGLCCATIPDDGHFDPE